MANRVSDCEVKEVFTTTLNTLPYIIAAHSVIAQNGLAAYPCHDEASLKEVERWLAAHFAATSDQSYSLQKEKMGDSEDTYFDRSKGEGLKGSSFGQQAILLDCSGVLAILGKRKARFEVL
jgi:hypothetical protein